MTTAFRCARRLVVPAGLVLLSMLCSPAASYGQTDQNIALFNARYRSGMQALEKQDYAEAVKHFQLAYAQKPEALLLYNIAQCHRKLNHEAEAITYFQSFLNTPETVDPQLRAKAEKFIAELRSRQASASPKVIYVENERESRPAWRLGLGAGLLVASTLPLGFGGRALYLDGACADTPMGAQLKCTNVVDTQVLGTGLLVTGVLLAVGGALTMALPGRVKQVKRPADDSGSEVVVKPIAMTLPLVPLSRGSAELPAAAGP